MRTQSIIVENIHIGERLRAKIDEETVKGLVDSIGALGLRNPISVIFHNDVEIDGELYDSVPVLVAGLHRLEALKRLGWTTVDCDVFDDAIDADQWEISENFHRSDLTVDERGVHFRKWVDLEIEKQKRKGVFLQVANKLSSRGREGEGRPEGGVDAAARALGLESTEAHRLASIGNMSEEALASARTAGLNNNQSVLLAAARDGKAVVKQAKAEGKAEDDAEVQRAKAEAERTHIERAAEERRRKAAEQAEQRAKQAAERTTKAEREQREAAELHDQAHEVVELLGRENMPYVLGLLEGNPRKLAAAIRELMAV